MGGNTFFFFFFSPSSSSLNGKARTTTKPIVESETYQQLSKDLSQAIHDASSRYGGVTTKEFRDLIKQRRLLDHVYASSNVTSMNLILHPSSSSTPSSSSSSSSSFSAYLSNASLLQQWKKVSEVLKMSDRLWISWPRWFFYSFQNILAPLFEGTEMSRAITKIKKLDPNFNLETFLKEAREFMLPEILDAWLKGDQETLSVWCSEASVNVLTAPNLTLQQQNLESGCRLLELTTVDGQARLVENKPVIMVTFQTQEILVFRDKTTKVIQLGKEDHILKCNYILVLALQDTFPVHPITKNWKVIDQSKHTLGATL
ncbi:protein translocase subunit [Coelomomyces lativittatus]|nr:protein translocase subunit [Coelomomyces lativittatus]